MCLLWWQFPHYSLWRRRRTMLSVRINDYSYLVPLVYHRVILWPPLDTSRDETPILWPPNVVPRSESDKQTSAASRFMHDGLAMRSRPRRIGEVVDACNRSDLTLRAVLPSSLKRETRGLYGYILSRIWNSPRCSRSY